MQSEAEIPSCVIFYRTTVEENRADLREHMRCLACSDTYSCKFKKVF